MTAWQDFKAGKITMAEYGYLTEVVEELEATERYMANQKRFVDSLGIESVKIKDALHFHDRHFRKVLLRDGTICMSCKKLSEEQS